MDAWFSVFSGFIVFILTFLLILMACAKTKQQQGHWIPNLGNKHVLVTGGSRGIGLAIAIQVLQQGGFVTLISNSSSEIEEALRNHLTSYPDKVFTKVADVGDYESISGAIRESFRWRPFDIVICNAGVAQKIGFMDEADVRELDLVIRTNLTGVLRTTHDAVPLMKQRGNQCRQSLVLMGSIASLHPVYGHSIYTATKHALKGMAEVLRLELLPFDIRVTLCCPDFTRTPLLKDAGHFDAQKESFVRIMKVVDLYNEKRLKEPTEIAKATVKGIKEGSFLVVVASNKLQEVMVSAFSRGLFPAESVGRTIKEMIVFLLYRLPSHRLMVLAQKTIAREHMRNVATL